MVKKKKLIKQKKYIYYNKILFYRKNIRNTGLFFCNEFNKYFNIYLYILLIYIKKNEDEAIKIEFIYSITPINLISEKFEEKAVSRFIVEVFIFFFGLLYI